MNLDFVIFIPARISSKRLPRKPLIDIFGVPMIIRTYNKAASVFGKKNIFVITDSKEITELTDSYGIQSILTSSKCLTGSDRVSEAALKLNVENIYNLQGDEPFFPKEDLKTFFDKTVNKNENFIGITPINSIERIKSLSIPKVVLSNSHKILYTSRSPIPSTKRSYINPTFRQVCIYKYKRDDLFSFYGPSSKKGQLEELEDLEILRLLENDIQVNTVLLSDKSFSIDTQEDLKNLSSFIDSKNE